MESTFSHFGLCVSDLEHSVRFYCEALGFEKAESHAVGNDFARLMDLEEVAVNSQFLRKGPSSIELLGFDVPSPFGERERRPLNRLGLTHLSFRVDDLDATAARIVACGGGVVETSRTSIELGAGSLRFLYCTDPDGVRIELMDLGS